MSGGIFGCQGSYWHLVSRDHRCCWTSYNAQDSPHNKELASPKCHSANTERLRQIVNVNYQFGSIIYFVKIIGFTVVQEQYEFILSLMCVHILYYNKIIFINTEHSWQFYTLSKCEKHCSEESMQYLLVWVKFFLSIFLFNEKKIYLAVLDLSFDMQTLSCSMWDIVPWTWIEPRLPALGAVEFSYWTIREVPHKYLNTSMWQKLLGASATSMKITGAFAPIGNLCDRKTIYVGNNNATAAAKSPQSCLTLCDPIDCSPPASPVPGILQARTVEWVAISFSNAWKWKVKVKSLSRARLLATPWTAAYQAPPSMGFSRQEYWSGVPLPSPR